LRTKALIPKVAKPAVPAIKPPIIVKQSPTQLANAEKAKIVEGKLDAGVRINRCFPEFSRTQSDRLVESGRVTVNGQPAKLGTKLCKGDVVMLDGTEVQWSQYVEKTAMPYPKGLNLNNGFVYIKYFKDLGVTTTAGRAPDGVLNTGHFKNVTQTIKSKVGGKDEVSVLPVDRLLPVGRLDNQSTGALLLTSDPRLPAWVLGANTGCSKVRTGLRLYVCFCVCTLSCVNKPLILTCYHAMFVCRYMKCCWTGCQPSSTSINGARA
jgi:hypothetical protein